MKSQTIRATLFFFSSISLTLSIWSRVIRISLRLPEAFSKQGIWLDRGRAPGFKSAYVSLKEMDQRLSQIKAGWP